MGMSCRIAARCGLLRHPRGLAIGIPRRIAARCGLSLEGMEQCVVESVVVKVLPL